MDMNAYKANPLQGGGSLNQDTNIDLDNGDNFWSTTISITCTEFDSQMNKNTTIIINIDCFSHLFLIIVIIIVILIYNHYR